VTETGGVVVWALESVEAMAEFGSCLRRTDRPMTTIAMRARIETPPMIIGVRRRVADEFPHEPVTLSERAICDESVMA
jgi:hypothetical protein